MEAESRGSGGLGRTKLGLHVPPFDYTVYGDNIGHEWEQWLRSFEICMKASQIDDHEQKHALLLHFAGSKVQEVYASLPRSVNDNEMQGPMIGQYVLQKTEFERTVSKLNEFFLPKKNNTYDRHILRQIKQGTDERIAIFAMRLRVQGEKCDYGNALDDTIQELLIGNCRSSHMLIEMMKAVMDREMNLTQLVNFAQVIEAVNEQEKPFKKVEEVSKIEVKSTLSKPARPYDGKTSECVRCGGLGHKSYESNCPAKGKTCFKCGGIDHFGRKCRSSQRPYNKTRRPAFNINEKTFNKNSTENRKQEETIKFVDNSKNDDYVFCIKSNITGNEIKCLIGGVEAYAIIDSGSTYNLMDSDTWKKLKSMKVLVANQRKETDKVFKSYGDNTLTIIGVFEAVVQVANKTATADFYVIREKGKFLLGRETATMLGILKVGSDVNKIDIIDKPKTIGQIKGIVVEIPIKEDAKPVIQPYRRVPVPLENAVDNKINELLEQDIIEPVNGPSKWISPVVVVPKENDVRICVDMRRANEAVERENHPLPTMEDFLPHIGKAKWFSKIDIKNAFHQVLISEKSREITTFITRKGLFRYKRLMFGITCAPELFQKIIEGILTGCEGCLNYIDDIMVYGVTKEQHDVRLQKVLATLREHEVTLNAEKCIFGTEKLQFLGHTLSANGISPDNDKIIAIKQFREPRSAEETRSFLGLVNYVGKFVPDLATVTDSLRSLTKKNVVFTWAVEQQKAFDKLKQIMTSDMILGYYDVEDKTQLYADASPVGLGAVLVQFNADGSPRIISYASKSLSAVEKRYAQTEKEALALVWAVERFHFYLFGRSFELVTDHKPLEVIFGPKSKPCARIERWVLRLQSYKYTVVYKPGKNNIADPLSRLIGNKIQQLTFDEGAEHYVNFITSNAVPVALKMCQIEEHSLTDSTIKSVKTAIYENTWSEESIPFKIFANELCFAGEILLRGTRIVMPKKLQNSVLELAHEGHPGMTVMKRRLRAKVWWPKIDQQVETFVNKCHGCTLVAVPSAPEPMKRKELPSEPWQHIAIDFLGPLPTGHNLFVIVDYYSRFIEIEIMKKIDATETIKRLTTIFARFGLPLTITADNGPQFNCEEFRSFCNTNNIKIISTIPYWPQQNGEIERQNRSILKRLVIAHQTGTSWIDELNIFLLMYRSTQHSTTLKTPSEMMFGRNIRDKLPNIHQPLEKDEEISDRDKERKEKGKVYADNRRNAKESDIQIGDKVLVKRTVKTNKLASNFEPTPHEVIGKKGSEVIVEEENSNKKYRRNVAHLKRVYNDASDEQPMEKRKSRPPFRFDDFIV